MPNKNAELNPEHVVANAGLPSGRGRTQATDKARGRGQPAWKGRKSSLPKRPFESGPLTYGTFYFLNHRNMDALIGSMD